MSIPESESDSSSRVVLDIVNGRMSTATYLQLVTMLKISL